MKYIKMVRKNEEVFSLGDLIKEKQPEIFRKLSSNKKAENKEVDKKVVKVASNIEGSCYIERKFKFYKSLMEQKPRMRLAKL